MLGRRHPARPKGLLGSKIGLRASRQPDSVSKAFLRPLVYIQLRIYKEYDSTSRLHCLPLSPYSSCMIVCKLREVLKRKGWTRYKLHKKSGVTYPTLHAMYHGRSKLYSAAVLEKICRTLRCQPGDLLRWEPQRFPRFARRKKVS
jgi:putative transcriptional regulator